MGALDMEGKMVGARGEDGCQGLCWVRVGQKKCKKKGPGRDEGRTATENA